jgi:transcriptional regulator with XRE-family HTH domain
MQVGLNISMRFSTLAARLRHARNQKQLTQVQLSALSGVRQSDISKIDGLGRKPCLAHHGRW